MVQALAGVPHRPPPSLENPLPLSVFPRALATSVAMTVVASVSVFGLAQPALAASTTSAMTPSTSAVASLTDTASTDYTSFVDPFVSTAGDDGNAALAASCDRDDVPAELLGIRTGHDDILPVSASQH